MKPLVLLLCFISHLAFAAPPVQTIELIHFDGPYRRRTETLALKNKQEVVWTQTLLANGSVESITRTSPLTPMIEARVDDLRRSVRRIYFNLDLETALEADGAIPPHSPPLCRVDSRPLPEGPYAEDCRELFFALQTIGHWNEPHRSRSKGHP